MRCLFVYGTLLDPAQVTRVSGRRLILQPARLDGFQRVQLRGTEYPTLRRGSGTVHGAVLHPDDTAFRRLCAYEGPRYRLTPVTPHVAGAAVQALAWIAPDATRIPWP